MEAAPTVPCHQAASCLMLLWFFPRKLVKAISGEAKTVISVHGRSWTFFLTGDVQCARVRKQGVVKVFLELSNKNSARSCVFEIHDPTVTLKKESVQEIVVETRKTH